jgi:DNA-binding NtrC family response regulator
MSAAAIEKLRRYDFPGNIRELRNLIERALILSTGSEIGSADFPLAADEEPVGQTEWIRALPDTVNLKELLEQVEKELILRALEAGGGVRAEAARRLQLSRSDLAYKLTKYSIGSEGD